jgi:hypothetical protein
VSAYKGLVAAERFVSDSDVTVEHTEKNQHFDNGRYSCCPTVRATYSDGTVRHFDYEGMCLGEEVSE